MDLHIDEGRGDKLAIIYDSPITGTKKNITYNELRNKVALFAGALKNQGVNKGDRVIIYMPMIPEAVTKSFAFESSILLASSLAAKPPKTTECTAPILPHASIVITASGIIGI